MREINFYYMDLKYHRAIEKVKHVPSIAPQIGKENRPFVGIVVLVNGRKYCVPLSSPKNKLQGKSKVDFLKIMHPTKKNGNGASKIIGIINFNNMIPIDESVITKIDITIRESDSISVKNYKGLLQDQLRWCREERNFSAIEHRANKVYDIVVNNPDKDRNLVKRCCDFRNLEAILDNYIQKTSPQKQPQPKPQIPPKSKPMQTFTISREQLNRNAKRIHEQAENNPTPTHD